MTDIQAAAANVHHLLPEESNIRAKSIEAYHVDGVVGEYLNGDLKTITRRQTRTGSSPGPQKHSRPHRTVWGWETGTKTAIEKAKEEYGTDLSQYQSNAIKVLNRLL